MTTSMEVEVRAELLDCMQANLALLADWTHGPGTHLALGTELRFATMPVRGLPSVEPGLEDHLLAARRWLGLAVAGSWKAGGYDDLCRGHGLVYVVADAFDLPWVPYYMQRHMEHSFLLDSRDGFVVHDAYHTDTEWGPARPGRWELAPSQLADAVRNGARVFRFEAVDPPVDPVPRLVPAPQGALDAYVRAYRDHPNRSEALDRLTLETWLLARSRRLHATRCAPSDEIDQHVRQWELLAEQTYLAWRRVVRGRPEPTGVLPRLTELLEADQVVFGGLRPAVAAVVAGVLGVDAAEVLAGTPFPVFPSFSSFRLIDIVERLESEFAVEFDGDDLVPEHLHHLDDLCRLVARSQGDKS